jgi:hypothetical protein
LLTARAYSSLRHHRWVLSLIANNYGSVALISDR